MSWPRDRVRRFYSTANKTLSSHSETSKLKLGKFWFITRPLPSLIALYWLAWSSSYRTDLLLNWINKTRDSWIYLCWNAKLEHQLNNFPRSLNWSVSFQQIRNICNKFATVLRYQISRYYYSADLPAGISHIQNPGKFRPICEKLCWYFIMWSARSYQTPGNPDIAAFNLVITIITFLLYRHQFGGHHITVSLIRMTFNLLLWVGWLETVLRPADPMW